MPASPVATRSVGASTAPGRSPLLASGPFEVVVTDRADDLAELFRLRRAVFAAEYGGGTTGNGPLDDPLDCDHFDAHCHHLVVRDTAEDRIVGGYRVLLPDGAIRAGGLYTESEFDLSPLAGIRSGLVELGRACIAGTHRNGIVLMLLWKAMRRFVAARGGAHVIGCCSLPIDDGGLAAARLYRTLVRDHGVEPQHRVRPRCPLPVDALITDATAVLAEPVAPALLRGYLKAGGRILGAPHLDRGFGSADIPLLLEIDALAPRLAARLN